MDVHHFRTEKEAQDKLLSIKNDFVAFQYERFENEELYEGLTLDQTFEKMVNELYDGGNWMEIPAFESSITLVELW